MIALVFNPAAGRRVSPAVVASVRAILSRRGAVLPCPTSGPGGARRLAAEVVRAHGGGPLLLVALGGDGTLNEVAWGAFEAGAFGDPGRDVRLAVLPAGSTNVVARSLGLPPLPVPAAEALASARERSIDLGVAEGPAGTRPFLLACGVGLEAEAVLGVSKRLKRAVGRHAYVVSGLRRVGDRRREILVSSTDADGREARDVPAESVIAGNAPLYGGSLRLACDAAFDDGLFELVVVRTTRLLPLLFAGLRALRTEMRGAAAVEVRRVRRARVVAPRPVACHVDAEAWSTTPLDLAIRPRAVRVLAP